LRIHWSVTTKPPLVADWQAGQERVWYPVRQHDLDLGLQARAAGELDPAGGQPGHVLGVVQVPEPHLGRHLQEPGDDGLPGVLGDHGRRGEQGDAARVAPVMLVQPVRHGQAQFQRRAFAGGQADRQPVRLAPDPLVEPGRADRERAAGVTGEPPPELVTVKHAGDGIAVLGETVDAVVGEPAAQRDHQVVVAQGLHRRAGPVAGHDLHPPRQRVELHDLGVQEDVPIPGVNARGAQQHRLQRIAVRQYLHLGIGNERQIRVAVDHHQLDRLTRVLPVSRAAVSPAKLLPSTTTRGCASGI
jgi:hypothetical protein